MCLVHSLWCTRGWQCYMLFMDMFAFDVDLSSNRFKEQSCAPVWCSLEKRVQVNCNASLWSSELRSERETLSACISSIAEERAEWKVQCGSTQNTEATVPYSRHILNSLVSLNIWNYKIEYLPKTWFMVDLHAQIPPNNVSRYTLGLWKGCWYIVIHLSLK